MSTTDYKATHRAIDHSTGLKEYRRLEQLIFDKAGVNCTIRISDGIASIRTKDYTDYVLAAAEIRGQTSNKIIRDVGTP